VSAAPVEAFGPYLVYEQLGSGGMARVDRAAIAGIEGFQRQVALKRMLPHVAEDDDMVKAFVREARLASHLRHANVAQTYELGKVDGIYFIAMELITGPTLRAVLKHCAQTTGPMPVPVALNIINQICDALDYAHNLCDETGQALGIIHRDVSPSNIIIDDAGVAKLIDFGIAKVSSGGMQTMSGTIKGKFGYMAPEYIVGRLDARADLFAVGVIAHELLTNRPLFSVADDMETLRRVRQMPLQPPSRHNSNVPAEIDDVVMTALSRDPDHRWQHATALRTAMTTLTQRLGLVCTNQQMVEWIAWAFEQAGPHDEGAAESDPSLRIEGPTRSDRPWPQRAAASSQKITLVSSRPQAAAGAGYAGLGVGGRTTEDVATLIRPSVPRIERPSASSAGPARTRGLTEQPPAPPPELQDLPSDPGLLDETVLDPGLALRARSASPSAPPPPLGSLAPRPPSRPSAPPAQTAQPAPSPPRAPSAQPAPNAQPAPSPPFAVMPLGVLGSLPPQGSTIPSRSPPPPAVAAVQRLAPPRALTGAEAPMASPRSWRRSSTAWVVVLVLLAAGLAAAGVYLVLSHLT
jgi:serine/threonine protein kinase